MMMSKIFFLSFLTAVTNIDVWYETREKSKERVKDEMFEKKLVTKRVAKIHTQMCVYLLWNILSFFVLSNIVFWLSEMFFLKIKRSVNFFRRHSRYLAVGEKTLKSATKRKENLLMCKPFWMHIKHTQQNLTKKFSYWIFNYFFFFDTFLILDFRFRFLHFGN